MNDKHRIFFAHWGAEKLRTTSQSRIRSTAPLPRGASGEEAKLYGMPRPPLVRGGGSASALTERLNFSYSSPPILSFMNSEVRKTKT